jgi:hypothetical protein
MRDGASCSIEGSSASAYCPFSGTALPIHKQKNAGHRRRQSATPGADCRSDVLSDPQTKRPYSIVPVWVISAHCDESFQSASEPKAPRKLTFVQLAFAPPLPN